MARRIGALGCLAAVAAVLASGCGFTPLHASGSAAAPATLSQVSIARIDDRPGQMLRNRLLDKMNPHGVPVEPKYVLVVRLRESTERLALRRDATATRANLRISADYSLRRADGDSVLRGTSSFTGSYNVLLDDFATLSAENDARRRVTEELSEDIKNRVAIFLARPRQSNDSEPK